VISDSIYFVTHLECSLNGDRYEAGQLHNLSKRESRCLSGTTWTDLLVR